MGLTLVTAPISDPVALDEAKAHCRVTSAEEDGLLAGYLLAARQQAETYTRRAFVTQVWDLTIDDNWPQAVDRSVHCNRDRIVLPKPPVQSVDSISYVDTSGATQILPTNQYRALSLNQERAEAFIEPAYGVSWPAVRRQAQTITVRFTCGYLQPTNPFPETIRQAILLLFGHFNENREPVNVGNIISEMPLSVESLLFPYRLFY